MNGLGHPPSQGCPASAPGARRSRIPPAGRAPSAAWTHNALPTRIWGPLHLGPSLQERGRHRGTAKESLPRATPSRPGRVGTTPGSVGTTPGSVGTTPGSVGTTPGSVGTTPGRVGTTPGRVGTTPGRVGTAEGHPNDGAVARALDANGGRVGTAEGHPNDGAVARALDANGGRGGRSTLPGSTGSDEVQRVPGERPCREHERRKPCHAEPAGAGRGVGRRPDAKTRAAWIETELSPARAAPRTPR